MHDLTKRLSTPDGRMRTLTSEELSAHYKETGVGLDSYVQFRPFVESFLDTVETANDIERALAHASIIHELIRGADQTVAMMRSDFDLFIVKNRARRPFVVPSLPTAKVAETPAPAGKRYVTEELRSWPTDKTEPIPFSKRPSLVHSCESLECNKPLAYDGNGRPPRYCDNKCKMKAYRARKKLTTP